MNKLLSFAVCALLLFTSCENNKKWEYKVISISGTTDYTVDSEPFQPLTFRDPTGLLDNAGKEGWELVNTYTEVNTTYPNFGNNEYVTGLRSNVRTTKVNFVLKRQVTEKNGKQVQ